MSLKKKMCGSGPLCGSKSFVNTINHFFLDWTTPIVFTILVGGAMAGGVIGLMFANRQCETISNSNQEYGSSYGYPQNHRMFFNTLHERPANLPPEVTRTIDVCLLATVREKVEKIELQDGTFAYDSQMSTCVMGTPEWFEQNKWPKWLRFCKSSELMPTVKEGFTRYNVETDPTNSTWGCRVGTDEGCEYVDPWEWQKISQDRMYPGWGCNHLSSNPKYEEEYDCAKELDSSVYPETYKGKPLKVFHCYASEAQPRDHGFRWPEFGAAPYTTTVNKVPKTYRGNDNSNGAVKLTGLSSGSRAWTIYYQVTVTDTEEICPTWILAFTAAVGFVPYLELGATIFICGLLIMLGISKPIKENASMLSLVKSAGMAEVLDDMTDKLTEVVAKVGGDVTIGGTKLGLEPEHVAKITEIKISEKQKAMSEDSKMEA